MRRAVAAVAVVALALTAGCAQLYEVDNETAVGTDADAKSPTMDGEIRTPGGTPGTVMDGEGEREDPSTDAIGWEDGVWHDESIAVDPSDGLNDTELDRVVARAMARVEHVRRLEFDRDVSVEVISREEYRQRNSFGSRDDPLRDQLHEALFLIDEDTDTSAALETLYGGAVGGYYFADQIVLVAEDGTTPVAVDRGVLAHELTHALQDQQFSLSGRAGDSDESVAALALPEGEANYVEDRYLERCGEEWSCLPPVESGAGGADINLGLFLTIYVPYSDGPTFVEHLLERDGWAAVNDAWDRPPRSSEQVIHPEAYPDEEPVPVTVEDRSAEEWEPVTGAGRVSTTAGEAGLFAMLYANGVVPNESLFADSVGYNYSHPASTGWGGDALRAYRSDGEFAYVFETVWDTERDARQFEQAYRDLLERQGATRVDGDYRIEDGGFADAFRVTRVGRTVRIVNAPTVEDLSAVHGPSGPRARLGGGADRPLAG